MIKFLRSQLPLIKYFLPFIAVLSLFAITSGYLNALSEEALRNTPMGSENLNICQFFSNISICLLASIIFVARRFLPSFKLLLWSFNFFLLFYFIFLFILFPFGSSWDMPSLFVDMLQHAKRAGLQDKLETFHGVWVFSLFNIFIRACFTIGFVAVLAYFLEITPFILSKKLLPFLIIIPQTLLYAIPSQILPLERVSYSFMGSINFSYFSFFGSSLVFNLVLCLLIYGVIRFLPSSCPQDLTKESAALEQGLKIVKPLTFLSYALLAEFALYLCFLSVSSIWNQIIRIEYPNHLELTLYLDLIQKQLVQTAMLGSVIGAFVIYFFIKHVGWRSLVFCLPIILLVFGAKFFIPLLQLENLGDYQVTTGIAASGETYYLLYFLLNSFIWAPSKSLAIYGIGSEYRFRYKLLIDTLGYICVVLLGQLLLFSSIEFFQGFSQLTLYFLVSLLVSSILLLFITLRKLTRPFA
ncbi:MAG: hypothetical protein GWP59_00125 [Chlamydiales bacterium]|nr:hypothetical protein [Chlamydiales bacterium]